VAAGLGSLTLMLGIAMIAVPASAASAAQATGGQQYCFYNGGNACLNAWSGGPWVKVYTGGFENRDSNEEFSEIVDNNTGWNELEFTGAGNNHGLCIGDAGNSPGNADTALVGCGSTTTDAGWGTNFRIGTTGCSAGQEWFRNVHWNGYLGPPNNWVNGSHFYLNKPTPYCFKYQFVIG